MCADVDCQLDFLPGLGCLNYPSAIGPIVENLPNFIRSKWEKRVVQYAEDHMMPTPASRNLGPSSKNKHA